MNLIQTQKFTEKIALEAGKILLRKFGKSKIAVDKGKRDFATDADLASERLILRAIKKDFPHHGIFAEESGSCAVDSEYCWAVDPLDGTKNFQGRLAVWCVSIALMRRLPLAREVSAEGAGSELKPIVGVVYAPLTNELYSARLGGGAKLNGKRIKVSVENSLPNSLALIEVPHASARQRRKEVQLFVKIMNKIWRTRLLGAAAYELCLVARGMAEAYIDLSRTTKIWDIAAGQLIVAEAGGRVVNTTPKGIKLPHQAVFATNAKLHGKIKQLLK